MSMARRNLFVFMLIWTSLIQAQEVGILPLKLTKVEYTKVHGRILVQGPSCAAIKDHVAALRSWAIRRNAQCEIQEMPASEFCDHDVTGCLPPDVAKFQSLLATKPGPNCWNFAAVLNGFLPNLRHTSNGEILNLTEVLCKKRDPSEAPQSGDLVLVEDKVFPEARRNHGFIWISELLALSKNGATNGAPYGLTSVADLLAAVPIPPCALDRTAETCEFTTHVFHACRTMKKYLSDEGFSKSARGIFDHFEELERRVEQYNFSPGAADLEGLEGLNAIAQTLQTYVKSAAFSAALATESTPRQQILLNLLSSRLNSMHAGVSDWMGVGHLPDTPFERTLQGMVEYLDAKNSRL